MTRRLLTVITGQPLPNYIALSEPATRPDVVHCIYTAGNPVMERRLTALRTLAGSHFPDIEFAPIEVEDAYDSAALWALAHSLLTTHKQDQWLLNRTAGTEQMRAPLAEAFRLLGNHGNFRSFFVETERDRLTFVDNAWVGTPAPFLRGIRVTDYFALHGLHPVRKNMQLNSTEQDMHEALAALRFDDLMPSCGLRFGAGTDFDVEYDEVGTHRYRLHVFERKRWSKGAPAAKSADTRSTEILHDLEKLAYTRAIFGGPFGAVYWVLSGSYDWPAHLDARCAALGIHLIKSGGAKALIEQRERLALPPLKSD